MRKKKLRVVLQINQRKLPHEDCRNATPEEREYWGCFEASKRSVFDLDGEKLFRCPTFYLRDYGKTASEYVRAHGFYQSGYLPNEGTWTRQPAKLIKVFEVIDSVKREMENAER